MMKRAVAYFFCAIFILSFPGGAWAVTAALVNSPFLYTFFPDGTLQEAPSIDKSSSPYWWLSSGGELWLSGGLGKTMQGSAPATSKWRFLYSASNPTDTDSGAHPQNIFRLVSRSKWQNVRAEADFRIVRDNLSASPNRNASNGLLFMARYGDQYNLYYSGIRVDGAAVIKKKKNGKYYTLAYKKVLPGVYNAASNPNLLPKNVWIGLRTEVSNNPDGSTSIKLYMDTGKTGTWIQILSTKDDGYSYGGTSLSTAGYVGLRTDFMDIEFDNVKYTTI